MWRATMEPMELPWMISGPSVMKSTTSQAASAWSETRTPACTGGDRPYPARSTAMVRYQAEKWAVWYIQSR